MLTIFKQLSTVYTMQYIILIILFYILYINFNCKVTIMYLVNLQTFLGINPVIKLLHNYDHITTLHIF